MAVVTFVRSVWGREEVATVPDQNATDSTEGGNIEVSGQLDAPTASPPCIH
jgi:hypothetical protein